MNHYIVVTKTNSASYVYIVKADSAAKAKEYLRDAYILFDTESIESISRYSNELEIECVATILRNY